MSASTFFSRQRQTQQQSRWLLLLFVLSLIALSVLIHGVSALVSVIASKAGSNGLTSHHAILLTAIVFFMIALGCLFRFLEVRQGGAALARHYGAKQVNQPGQSRQQRMLWRVTEEMAIASRQKMPSLWILAREHGINAFVAGNSEDDLVLVVTQGALDSLDRDELQALVAHEMGHIRNGDIPTNMKLLIVLSGLLALDQIGHLLTGRDAGKRFAPLAIVGLVLRGLGGLGVLLAGLIRAAFGRQREFLADASAVQFTRQSIALARVLDRVQLHAQGARLTGYYADEISHLCFLSPDRGWRSKKLFSVHPDIIDRIQAIEPGYIRSRDLGKPRKTLSKTSSGSGQKAGLDALATAVTVALTDSVTPDINPSGLSDDLQILIAGNSASEAMLFALLAQQFDGDRALFFKAMTLKGKTREAEYAENLIERYSEKISQYTLELIEHAGSNLKDALDENQRLASYKLMEKFVLLDRSCNFREFVLLELIGHKLGISGKFEAPDVSFSLQQAAGLVISLVVEAAGGEAEMKMERFNRYASVYGATDFSLRSVAEPNIVDDVKSALFVLENQMPALRQRFIQHCSEMVLDDQKETQEERVLLNLLSVTLATRLPISLDPGD